MIKNYFKIAWRNLWRHKSFSLINIIGLAVGMTACMLIFMYVKFELSYDNFNEKGDQIYRVITDIKSPTETTHVSLSLYPIGPALQQDYHEVIANTHLADISFLVQNGNAKFQEDNLMFAEPSLFKMFTLPVITGDAGKAFEAPFTLVITQKLAKKYFGNADPVGKFLLLEGKYPALITALIKDVPLNSNFQFDMLVSLSTIEKLSPGITRDWGNFNNYTYIMLPEGYNWHLLQNRLPEFVNRHYSKDDKRKGEDYDFFLEPLKNVYMDSALIPVSGGNLYNVRIFSLIAVFILLIACINFINLTTARAMERAREVGIRKVIGAMKKQLVIQFLSESVIICMVAFVLSILLSALVLPVFNELAGKLIIGNILSNGYLLWLFVISFAIGIVAGLYPALVLSGFRPIATLKGQFSSTTGGIWLRKSLVVIQFTISIVLIVGTVVVYKQLNYMQGHALGFKKDQMVSFDFYGDSAVTNRSELIKTELKSIPNVLSAAVSGGLPGFNNNVAYSQIENAKGVMQATNMNLYDVDFDFIPQLEIKLAAGRAFSTAFATDSTQAIVINETAARILGFHLAADAIGHKFEQWGARVLSLV